MATIEDMKGFLTSADVVEAVRAGSAIENTLLNEIDLSGLDLQGATFDTVTFNAVHLIDIALRGATLSNVVFNNCMMSGADFTKAKLSGTIFVNADCCQANFTRADLADALFLVDNVPEKDQEKVLFEFDAFELDEDTQNVLRAQGIVGFSKGKMRLCSTDFSQANLKGAMFMEAELDEVLFQESILERARFEDCSLLAATFTKGLLDNTLFETTNLSNAVFSEVNLHETTFKEVNFTDVDCRTAVLEQTEFHNTVFTSFKEAFPAQLTGCVFEDCDLHGKIFPKCSFPSVLSIIPIWRTPK